MSVEVYTAEKDELGVIGACLMGGAETAADAVAMVTPSMVVSDAVRDVLEIVSGLVTEGAAVTLESICRAWKKAKGQQPAPLEILDQAMEVCPSAANLSYHADGVIEAFRRRALRDASHRLLTDSGNPTRPVDVAIADFEAGIGTETDHSPAPLSARTVALGFVDDLQDRVQRQGTLSGVPTGIYSLDAKTDGLQFREMCIIGARPSIGKTALGVTIIHNACVDGGVPALFVTCEMSPRALMRRLIASVGNVDMWALKRGQLNEGQMKAVTTATAKINRSPLHFIDSASGANIATITAAIRRAVRKHKVKLVVVDYLQIITPASKHEKRTYEVADVSKRLKACAVSCDVAMVVLAQLNRDAEKEGDKMPSMRDLADSGQIERDADVIGLLHRRRDDTEGEALLLVVKQRDGETGVVNLHFSGKHCRFESVNQEIE